MSLFDRFRRARPVTERAVEPFGVRFADVLTLSGRERDALIDESALWEIPRHLLEEGEVQWVTCGGVWVPPDAPPMPVRYYLTDRRMLMLLDSPHLPPGHDDFRFDDMAVFDPEGGVKGRPKRVRYVVITSESGRPEDGIRATVEFNLDAEGQRFVGTAITVIAAHGGLHTRLERNRKPGEE